VLLQWVEQMKEREPLNEKKKNVKYQPKQGSIFEKKKKKR
jgi:hypothetical protein